MDFVAAARLRVVQRKCEGVLSPCVGEDTRTAHFLALQDRAFTIRW